MASEMVKMQGPKETSSVSIGGKSIDVSDGVAMVPETAVKDMAAHGFVKFSDALAQTFAANRLAKEDAADEKAWTKIDSAAAAKVKR
jgi:hypothetical protein